MGGCLTIVMSAKRKMEVDFSGNKLRKLGRRIFLLLLFHDWFVESAMERLIGYMTMLHNSASSEEVNHDELKYMLAAMDASVPSRFHEIPLCLAASLGCTTCVRLLLLVGKASPEEAMLRLERRSGEDACYDKIKDARDWRRSKLVALIDSHDHNGLRNESGLVQLVSFDRHVLDHALKSGCKECVRFFFEDEYGTREAMNRYNTAEEVKRLMAAQPEVYTEAHVKTCVAMCIVDYMHPEEAVESWSLSRKLASCLKPGYESDLVVQSCLPICLKQKLAPEQVIATYKATWGRVKELLGDSAKVRHMVDDCVQQCMTRRVTPEQAVWEAQEAEAKAKSQVVAEPEDEEFF